MLPITVHTTERQKYIFSTQPLRKIYFLVNFNFGASQVFDHMHLLGVRKTLGSWDRLYEERKVVSLGALENDYAHPTDKPEWDYIIRLQDCLMIWSGPRRRHCNITVN